MKRKYGALTSSTNPEEFSQTWGGLIGFVGTILTTLAMMKGVDMTVANEQIKQVTDAFTVIVMSGIAIWQGAQTLIGVVKKISIWFANK